MTFDTGALIALERKHQRIRVVFETAVESRIRITVPTVVVAEWWRRRTDLRELILESCDIEPLDDALARIAGEAVATIKDATINDAIVMASAARRGDRVYTSDFEDLDRLRRAFPAVRVLGV